MSMEGEYETDERPGKANRVEWTKGEREVWKE
jgi:hypothetical protein